MHNRLLDRLIFTYVISAILDTLIKGEWKAITQFLKSRSYEST